ncbi:MAG: efflux transporter protein [Hyphomicrobiales bacterium]|jgi:tripartite-type tricarboxylate transporter receptor subunit TctC|nr:efflux transporter protein [Hyphomicrobiales bacterium]
MTLVFRKLFFACAAIPGAIIAGAAQAQEFYTGKTVNIIVGSDVAGGYDTYARLFSRHLGDHLPGKPNMVVQNMPGAGSARAAGFLYASAAKDGMTIALLQPGAIVGPLVDKTMKANYDATKFTYLASADSGTRVCISLPNSHIKTFKQAQTERVIVGAAGNGASSRDYGFLHKNTSGAKFEIVSGYKGMADILLAMERKEIDVVCGLDWSSAKAQRPALVRDKSLNVLVQMGVDKNAELDAWGAPDIMTFTQGTDNRAIVELIVAQQAFGRPFLMAPGNPEIAVKQMRAAFVSAMKSPALLADAEKIGLDITPATGERVQDVVQKMYQTPDRIVDLASKAIRE